MARPRTPIGTYGDPYYEETDGGRQIAVVRFRDFDGRTRKIKAVGRSKAEALRRLKKKIANHEAASVGEEDLTADSLFVDLADAWLQSLDDTKRLAPSTRYRYERDLRTLVLPAFVSTSHRQRRPEAGPGPWWPLVVLTPLAPEAHLVGVTVSMRVVSAGKGYGYLLRSVVQGDGDATQASGFTRYFTDAGTPPGVWLGKGVTFFGAGELRPGMTVTPEQLQTLLGRGNDPVTGASLGTPFREYPSVAERTAALTARVDRALPAGEFDAEVTRIQAEQAARGSQTATAGFDLTFSVPKSVSVLWGLADANTQELIVEAHHAAVAQVLDFFEREVAATRTGHAGIAQVPVVGVAATAYDHWDSRANDPQLHTHVVVSNKVMAAHDGRWRTLDSRAVHHAVVGLSEHYNAVLADRLTGTFGLSWERRDRGEDRTAQWEIRGVGEDLIAAFSSRARAIDVATDAKIAAYVTKHGHRPTGRRIVQLRAEATLDTRPEKTIRALSDLTAEWRTRARDLVGGDPTEWARTLTTRQSVTWATGSWTRTRSPGSPYRCT